MMNNAEKTNKLKITLGIIVMSAIGSLGGLAGGKLLQSADKNKFIKGIAEENAKLPKQLDPWTTLTRVTVKDDKLQYFYKTEFTKENWPKIKENIRPKLDAAICKDENNKLILRWFPMVFNYQDKDNITMGSFEFPMDHCS